MFSCISNSLSLIYISRLVSAMASRGRKRKATNEQDHSSAGSASDDITTCLVLPEVRLKILRHDVCDYSAVHVRKVVESHFLWTVNITLKCVQ